ncbi:SDR family NAD(P)-dependent oxidoreductase [Kiloniella sp. EL199]|uniref:SDR family NAD(P)-dependent oxidoreductase n=1 Tax=Kiloniella sp. EL199 TaxID=2107581 RepID=UPI000EA1E48F|nr:SDR family NAD(P)-dependent oxidoreductase [Kiloniella sp. EL199]
MTNQSLFDLSGMNALISGGSGGIGMAIARQFLHHGANVLIGGHSQFETEKAHEILLSEFPHDQDDQLRVHSFVGDISHQENAANFVRTASHVFEQLDAVVCNAGIEFIQPALEYSSMQWDHILNVNLKGAFFVAQSATQMWQKTEQQRGTITFTSSIAGSVGIENLAPYASSKGGINQLTKTLAIEWAHLGIRVNAIAPGYAENIMQGLETHVTPEQNVQIERLIAMGRRGSVDEIAAPFVFLASSAASYITGAVLAVDGGYTAQ